MLSQEAHPSEPDERAVVFQLQLLSFMMGGALVFVDIAARALFLERFGAERLPYAYLGAALVVALIGAIYSWLQRVVSLRALTVAMALLLAATIAALWALITLFHATWLILALFIWYRLFYAFNGLLFWGLVGQLFTLRQSKRLTGRVGSGEPVAGVAGYFSAALIAGWVGTENLLLLTIGGLVVSVGLIALLQRREVPHADDVGQPPQQPPTRAGRTAPARRYVRLIVVIGVVTTLAYLFVDFGFSSESRRMFDSAEQLAAFFGVFFGVVAIGRIAARGVLSGWVLRRFGLPVGLMVLPVAMLLCAVLVVAGGVAGVAGSTFVLMALTRFVGSVVTPSIQRGAMQVLYQALPARQRLAAQTLVEGVVEPIAVGAGSLLLIGLTQLSWFSSVATAATLIVIAVAWIAAALLMLREYRGMLSAALARRLLEGGDLSFTDVSSRAVIEGALSSAHPGEVLYAMSLLASGGDQLRGRLAWLLHHHDPYVRREAAAQIGRLGAADWRDELQAAFVVETDGAVRAEIIKALGRAGELAAIDDLLGTDDVPPELGDAALTAGLKHGGAGQAAYAERLRALIGSEEAAKRARAAAIIGSLAVEPWTEQLPALMRDRDAQVRRAAIRAAGSCADGRTLAALLAALDDPATRGPATNVLARRGPAVVPAAAAAFADPARQPATLARLAHVLGRLASLEATALLMAQLAHPSDEVRHAVATALRRCGYRALGNAAQQVRAQIQAEAAGASWLQSAGMNASADGRSAALLTDALEVQVGQLHKRIFALLALIAEPRAIRRIQQHIHSQSLQKRDYAYELLDLHVDAELRRLLLPLLGADAQAQRRSGAAALGQGLPDVLASLIEGSDATVTPWLRACALFTARQIEMPALAGRISSAALEAAPLVRETHAWAAGGAGEAAGSLPTTLERTLALKTVSIFSTTRSDVLAEVAGLLSQVDLEAGAAIFARDDPGDSMYIVATGSVRIHNGDTTIGVLGPGEVFGEMALLDGMPRLASATALAATRLLRLDQEPFYELMDDRIAIAHGVIQVLNLRLRTTIRELNRLRGVGVGIEPATTPLEAVTTSPLPGRG